jgi:PIN domain nuclease of toxin-antitoxin system
VKYVLDTCTYYWFQKGLTQHGVICEPITPAIAHAAEMLPPTHNDPADRFILVGDSQPSDEGDTLRIKDPRYSKLDVCAPLRGRSAGR